MASADKKEDEKPADHFYHWWEALKRIPAYRDDHKKSIRFWHMLDNLTGADEDKIVKISKKLKRLHVKWGFLPIPEPLPAPLGEFSDDLPLASVQIVQVPLNGPPKVKIIPIRPKNRILNEVKDYILPFLRSLTIKHRDDTGQTWEENILSTEKPPVPVKKVDDPKDLVFEINLKFSNSKIINAFSDEIPPIKQVKTNHCPRSYDRKIWHYYDLKVQGYSIYQIVRNEWPHLESACIADSPEKKKVKRGIQYACKWIALVLSHRIQFELTN